MSTVEVPLGKYRYRFRQLTHGEEFALSQVTGEAIARSALSVALEDVSGTSVTSEGASLIVGALPQSVLTRMWVLYKAGLPEDRFFKTKGLFRAPEPNKITRQVQREERQIEGKIDRSLSEMERRFGAAEIAETKAIEQRLFEDARRRGSLTRPGADAAEHRNKTTTGLHHGVKPTPVSHGVYDAED